MIVQGVGKNIKIPSTVYSLGKALINTHKLFRDWLVDYFQKISKMIFWFCNDLKEGIFENLLS